jgi:hypothetical protein
MHRDNLRRNHVPLDIPDSTNLLLGQHPLCFVYRWEDLGITSGNSEDSYRSTASRRRLHDLRLLQEDWTWKGDCRLW